MTPPAKSKFLSDTIAPYEQGESGLFGESNRASLDDLTTEEAGELGGNFVDSPAAAPDTPALNGTDPTDSLTGQPTAITGRIFDEGKRQDVARRNRERMGQAARLGNEFSRTSTDQDDVRSIESSSLPRITLVSLGLERQGDHLVSTTGQLRALPTGSEATPFADDAAGVVYKLFPLAAEQTNGVKLAPKNGPDGWTVDSSPATALETLEKISLLHEIGAIPSEIVGITDSGAILVKQPLLTELSAEQKGNLLPVRAQAVAAVGGIQLANGKFPDVRVVEVDGKPYFMGDLHPGNIMLDAAGNPVIIDALISPVPERMQYDVPEVMRAVNEVASNTDGGEAQDDLFFTDPTPNVQNDQAPLQEGNQNPEASPDPLSPRSPSRQ